MSIHSEQCNDGTPHEWKCRKHLGEFQQHTVFTDLTQQQILNMLAGETMECEHGVVYCQKCKRLLDGSPVSEFEEDLGFDPKQILSDLKDEQE